ncbi:S-methyl-5-thioribose kinase [Sphingobium sufflavum]|uniref:S-methyl-5-thioribose kinase n=1 Tax=Sphingobium sufflavum TaxID=1129547 RepID=UPI001F43C3F6|nr:S-methyl-5-thioribose kinase [Sphingobium sufflavum]MCE7796349.1 S-methyl-5-thioribose kinase [Sphingobium sufflavum]
MSYTPLDEGSVASFLATIPTIAKRLGGSPDQWTVREVGDGNLNVVFLVTGQEGGVAAKQALPYVRLVGESWPLPLSRAYYERLALADQARWAPDRVPALLHHDDVMALTVMELLRSHRTLRGALAEGERYPLLAGHLAEFLADTLFFTSDIAMPVVEKKARIAAYLGNTAMCRISEDLIFDEPFFDAPMNHHTPGLEDVVAAFCVDVPLRLAAQGMKARFLAAPEALLHGDLHTGSVMVTEADTKIIDPEFAFYGPIGFDVGMLLANLWMACLAQPGQRPGRSMDGLLLDQAATLWNGFATRFAGHWRALERDADHGSLHALGRGDADLREAAIAERLAAIWQDALGFAGCEVIRRILGLAHVADFETIVDEAMRAVCERRALHLGWALLVERDAFPDAAAVAQAILRESAGA